MSVMAAADVGTAVVPPATAAVKKEPVSVATPAGPADTATNMSASTATSSGTPSASALPPAIVKKEPGSTAPAPEMPKAATAPSVPTIVKKEPASQKPAPQTQSVATGTGPAIVKREPHTQPPVPPDQAGPLVTAPAVSAIVKKEPVTAASSAVCQPICNGATAGPSQQGTAVAVARPGGAIVKHEASTKAQPTPCPPATAPTVSTIVKKEPGTKTSAATPQPGVTTPQPVPAIVKKEPTAKPQAVPGQIVKKELGTKANSAAAVTEGEQPGGQKHSALKKEALQPAAPEGAPPVAAGSVAAQHTSAVPTSGERVKTESNMVGTQPDAERAPSTVAATKTKASLSAPIAEGNFQHKIDSAKAPETRAANIARAQAGADSDDSDEDMPLTSMGVAPGVAGAVVGVSGGQNAETGCDAKAAASGSDRVGCGGGRGQGGFTGSGTAAAPATEFAATDCSNVRGGLATLPLTTGCSAPMETDPATATSGEANAVASSSSGGGAAKKRGRGHSRGTKSAHGDCAPPVDTADPSTTLVEEPSATGSASIASGAAVQRGRSRGRGCQRASAIATSATAAVGEAMAADPSNVEGGVATQRGRGRGRPRGNRVAPSCEVAQRCTRRSAAGVKDGCGQRSKRKAARDEVMTKLDEAPSQKQRRQRSSNLNSIGSCQRRRAALQATLRELQDILQEMLAKEKELLGKLESLYGLTRVEGNGLHDVAMDCTQAAPQKGATPPLSSECTVDLQSEVTAAKNCLGEESAEATMPPQSEGVAAFAPPQPCATATAQL